MDVSLVLGLELCLHHRSRDHADIRHARQGQGQDQVRRSQGAIFILILHYINIGKRR
jgi:hypothetical protein